MTDTPIEEMSFEAAMRALESVVSQLESGNVELEASINLYEHGAKLKAHCEKKLKEAEEKVHAITLNADGEATGTQPFDAG